jgi:lactate racemase
LWLELKESALEPVMRVVVDFQDESLEFEVAGERLVAAWNGPPAIDGARIGDAVRAALDEPLDYPAARQIVVPGDRVAIACDAAIAEPGTVLATLVSVLADAGVERGDVTVVAPLGSEKLSEALPRGTSLVAHDPNDRNQMMYLAATKEGRRIYLNRSVIDADVVIPVGRLGFDPIMGYRGPWSVIFPGLSDHETMQAYRGRLKGAALDEPADGRRPGLDESFEVSWLLGSAFHIGIVPAASAIAQVLAGRETSVREQGIASVDRSWRMEADSRAELVVVGIGGRGSEATLDDLAQGLANATRLVQHGGKIVVLSRASGRIGPSLRRLIDVDDPKNGIAALRGHEGDDDYLIARRLSHALGWADVFLHSRLDRDLAESLSVCALERPEQARRLVERSGSCLFLSQAELAHAAVRSENEGR